MRKLFFIMLFILPTLIGKCSHIVGGDISYVYMGNNVYQFTIYIYRDCLPVSQGGGNPSALADDEMGYFSIYRGNNFFWVDSFFQNQQFVVPVNFSNDCINNAPATCISRLRFQFSKTLPPSTLPYTLIYQRCCRNQSINNLINPGGTGATFMCTIPPSTTYNNSSAIFTNYPPQIICVNNPFVYDNSATDADGDSLSYEFCNAFDGADQQDPKPLITSPTLPFLQSVNYRSPFSSSNPIGGNPVLSINPITGVITGTPNILGRFVVTVCCNEWRNGVLINTIKRDFQFIVTNCSKAVVANTPLYSEFPNTYIVSCKSKTVHFDNISLGGFSYFWDFGVNGITTDTSSQFSPTYTYADTGTYIVKLLVNSGSTCPDTISRIVKVYPEFHTNYEYKGILCPLSPISFMDKSTTTYDVVNYWKWNFDDGTIDNVQNPQHYFPNIGKEFNVTLISGNKFGCRDTMTKVLPIPAVHVFAGNDTVIIKNSPIQFQGTGALNYSWIPSTFLDNSTISYPIGFYPDQGENTYILQGTTVNGCIGYDTINITVAAGPYIVVPNAFSPNGDGNNDYFKVLAAGFVKLNTFKIFDRWGKMVYSTKEFRGGWDGFVDGRRCDIGTYYWFLDAIDLDGKSKMLKGDVILVE